MLWQASTTAFALFRWIRQSWAEGLSPFTVVPCVLACSALLPASSGYKLGRGGSANIGSISQIFHETVCCLGCRSRLSDSLLCSYVSRWVLICVSERVKRCSPTGHDTTDTGVLLNENVKGNVWSSELSNLGHNKVWWDQASLVSILYVRKMFSAKFGEFYNNAAV